MTAQKEKAYRKSRKYYRSVITAEKMWEWLADNPDKRKKDWPKFEKLGLDLSPYECTICDYMFKTFSNLEVGEHICDRCFLEKTCSVEYHKWFNAKTQEDSHKYASVIYFHILKERLKLM